MNPVHAACAAMPCSPGPCWASLSMPAGLRPGRGRSAVVLVEGQAFERSVRLGGVVLRLNGTGVRAVAWFKGYAAGLYLADPTQDAAQALAAPGPKRLQIRMLQDVPAAEFEKAFTKGMRRNVAEALLAGLEDRMHGVCTDHSRRGPGAQG